MAERLHLLTQRPYLFEGRPHVFYPTHESLPPAPDQPEKKVKAQAAVVKRPELTSPGRSARISGAKELRPNASGQMCWQWSLARVAEVQRRLRAGERQSDIARDLKMGTGSVSGIRRDMVEAGEDLPPVKSGPAPAPAPKVKDKTPAQAPIQAAHFNGSDGERLLEHVARGAKPKGHVLIERAPVAQAGFAAPAPAPSPVPMPASLPAVPLSLPRPEAPRTHVLDWQRRMSAYSYTVAPEGCIPRKSKLAKGRRGLTHQQLNEAFYASPASGEINSKPQPQQRQRAKPSPSELFDK